MRLLSWGLVASIVIEGACQGADDASGIEAIASSSDAARCPRNTDLHR